MQSSLKTSFFGHLLIIVIGSLSFPFLLKKVEIPPIISVDLVQISDRTNIPYAPKVSDAAKSDKKEKERLVTTQAPPKIVPKEKPDAIPFPDKIQQIKELIEKKQNPVKVEEKNKQVSEFEKKETFDPNKISALIDKAKKESEETSKRVNLEATQSQQKNFITGTLTLSEQDAIKAQIFKCWNIPIGLPYDQNLRVRVKVQVNPDGSIISSEIIDNGKFNQTHHKILAESALRAVRLCNPLKVPKTGYEKWKEMILNFDAREMLKG